jgi:hypothetical protein
MTRTAFLIDGVRSPFGRYGGGLAGVRADDLLAAVIAALVARTKIPAERVDDVIAGCANQAGEDNRNVARMAALLAGLPISVPGVTVNRLCGSGMQAIRRWRAADRERRGRPDHRGRRRADVARAAGDGQGRPRRSRAATRPSTTPRSAGGS